MMQGGLYILLMHVVKAGKAMSENTHTCIGVNSHTSSHSFNSLHVVSPQAEIAPVPGIGGGHWINLLEDGGCVKFFVD